MSKAVQRYTEVVISGLAHVEPPHRVTSDELEKPLERTLARLGLGPGILERLAGIRARRFWDPGAQPSRHAGEAAEKLFASWPGERSDVGALINTSVCRDYIEPSTASIIHGELGLSSRALNFDLGNACLGFINGMNVVSAMIERGEIDHGLVVNAETTRFGVEATVERLASEDTDQTTFREQFATLTIGSGAVAMMLSRADAFPDGHAFLGGLSRAATEHARLSTAQVDEMRTDTAGLLNAGLKLAAETWREAVDTFDIVDDAVDLYAVHQVSRVHTEAVSDQLGADPAKVPQTFPEYGNIGPASVPFVLSKAADEAAISRGDRVVLMGIGSGLNASASEIVW